MGQAAGVLPNRLRRRRLRWLLAAAVVLPLLMLGVSLGSGLSRYQSALVAVRAHLGQAATAAISGEMELARHELTLASAEAAQARVVSSSPAWNMAGSVPGVGQPFRTTAELAVVTDDLVVKVLAPAMAAGPALFPTEPRPSGTQIDLDALVHARGTLAEASTAARALDDRAAAIEPGGYVAAVEEGRRTIANAISELAGVLDVADTAAVLLPPMLGAGGPRTYLVVFQTNAESRATGGLVGGFGLLTADGGRLRFDTLSSNRDLEAGAPPGIDLGSDYAQQYAGYSSTTLWANANSSPHFPYAAQIWSSLWAQQGGPPLDGVVAMDPVALGYLMAASGPVTLPGGDVIGANNVVAVTESDAYFRFANDNAARKKYLQSIASAVAEKLIDGRGPSVASLMALRRATGETRIAAWSADPDEQALLAGTALGHEVPLTADPYASMVVLNGAGDKLDFYLERSLYYDTDNCPGPQRSSRVSVDLRNGAPLGPLPESVAGPRARKPAEMPNANDLLVSLYATNGAQLREVTVNGVPVTARIGTERGHPVFTTNLLIPPQDIHRLVFELTEPRSSEQPIVPVQPLAQEMDVTVSVAECAAP